VVRLVGELLREAGGGGIRTPREPVPSRRRLADAAREALVHDPAVSGVGLLAERLGVSRSHLSRVFRQETGETLTCFRNRVRVRVALDRLAAGAPDLAGLAAELGFADHAHLSRAVRAEVGVPPRQVRDLLRVDHGPDEPRARMFKPAPHTRTTLEA
jgi:AraC-like DNA-binding protein